MTTGRGSYFVMARGGSIDYRLNHWRLRLVDFEYEYPLQFSLGGNAVTSITTGVRLCAELGSRQPGWVSPLGWGVPGILLTSAT